MYVSAGPSTGERIATYCSQRISSALSSFVGDASHRIANVLLHEGVSKVRRKDIVPWVSVRVVCHNLGFCCLFRASESLFFDVRERATVVLDQ